MVADLRALLRLTTPTSTFNRLYSINYYQKRLDRSHVRHLSAIRTLAQIRKMGPAV